MVITTADGERRALEADSVVLAAGSAPTPELATALREKVPTVMVVGDALQPRHFLEAIREGMIASVTV